MFHINAIGNCYHLLKRIDNIIVTMDDQKDNALSINICIKYKLVVFEPRHTRAVFLAGETKRIRLHFHLIVTNYYVRDRNVRNAPQIQFLVFTRRHKKLKFITKHNFGFLSSSHIRKSKFPSACLFSAG